MKYPKRLIEVDLPIKRISAHARREKSIRHGHISTLHIWWARRPLAACRAVILAALWPDPADELCPERFRKEAAEAMKAHQRRMGGKVRDWANPVEVRIALLDFIADFANWDNSTNPDYLKTSRHLVQIAHESLGGLPGTRPLVVDPFAGGGAIPLEALRVGADAFASDLNPVAVLLNKVVLEYIPKYGLRLAEEVRKWGEWIKQAAEKELAEFYPKDPDGSTPIAYLWARTVRCEGPGCGAEVPLMRSLWLAKKGSRSVALKIVPRPKAKRVDFEIVQDAKPKKVGEGTVRKGSATCPCCGYTTPVKSVRAQFKKRRGGAADARLFCVVTTRPGQQGRFYRLPTDRDLKAVAASVKELEKRKKAHKGKLSLVPDEQIDVRGIRHTWGMIYGMTTWGDIFTPRQILALTTLIQLVHEVGRLNVKKEKDGLADAVKTILALAVSRISDIGNSLCSWKPSMSQVIHLFTRQAIPMLWDFAEASPQSAAAGDFSTTITNMIRILEGEAGKFNAGNVRSASAMSHPLPDDSAHAFITDPPYYDAVPYAYLSDFFYVWLRRSLADSHPDLLKTPAVPKDDEIVVDRPHELSDSQKDITYYEKSLCRAFGEGRRVLGPTGIGTVVFASKTTASWEAILKAMVDAGWVLTASWPIDTEMETRVAAQGQARLASSIHLVCRPRENEDGTIVESVGDWRDVLEELPRRIHEWMPRLAAEGVVGADAIFACLGPALEIFSRYSRVEKPDGTPAPLNEYLERVWAAVAQEALAMVFQGADASGFEEDARLTAMWLWTLNAGADNGEAADGGDDDTSGDDEEGSSKTMKTAGFTLEYDAARKIAQGLGAHLEDLTTVIEVSGDKARLLPIQERAEALFGRAEKDADGETRKGKGRKKKDKNQLSLFEELEQVEEKDMWGEKGAPEGGKTVLDRVHQAMILFAASRSDALKRFLVDEGVGQDGRFWRLGQALAALYPKGTDERRWIEGVMARKKALGF